jgi:hypothetical protein
VNKKAMKPKPVALPLDVPPPPPLAPARVLKPMNTAFDREMDELRAKKAAEAAATVAPQAPKLAAVPGLKPEPSKLAPAPAVPAIVKPQAKPEPKALAKAPEDKPDPKPPTPPAAVAAKPEAAPKPKPQKREIYRIRIEDVRTLFDAFAEELGLNAAEIAQLHKQESGLDRKCFERLVSAVNAAADTAALNGTGVAIG